MSYAKIMAEMCSKQLDADAGSDPELSALYTHKLSSLRDAASAFPCDGKETALVMLKLIAEKADCIVSWVPDDSASRAMCEEFESSIRAMCYALMEFLQQDGDATPDPALVRYFGEFSEPKLKQKMSKTEGKPNLKLAA
ncbi:MAG: hypothetical protein AAF607_15880 [Pseudomonadota bacterium]